MSLVGVFTNTNTSEVLTITSANDANGQLTGTLTSGGRTLTVTGHYHYANSVGPATSITFIAVADDPNIYEAWAANTNAPNCNPLIAMGARATIVNGVMATVGLGGTFTR